MCSWSKRRLERSSRFRSGSWQICWCEQPLRELAPAVARHLTWPLPLPEPGGCPTPILARELEQASYRYAIERLARQSYSKAQLATRLQACGVPSEVAASALHRLELGGYLDEESMSAGLRERYQRRGCSQRQVQMRLRSKGLEAGARDLEADLSAAVYWLKRWARREEVQNQKERYFQRLVQRGFDLDLIQKAWHEWRAASFDREI